MENDELKEKGIELNNEKLRIEERIDDLVIGDCFFPKASGKHSWSLGKCRCVFIDALHRSRLFLIWNMEEFNLFSLIRTQLLSCVFSFWQVLLASYYFEFYILKSSNTLSYFKYLFENNSFLSELLIFQSINILIEIFYSLNNQANRLKIHLNHLLLLLK